MDYFILQLSKMFGNYQVGQVFMAP